MSKQNKIVTGLHLAAGSLGLAGAWLGHGWWPVTLILTLLWLAAAALLIYTWRTGRLPRLLSLIAGNIYRIRLITFLLLLFPILIAASTPVRYLALPEAFILFLVFYPLTLNALLIRSLPARQAAAWKFFINTVLVCTSLGVALGVVEVVLRRMPGLLPRAALQNTPAEVFGLTPELLLVNIPMWKEGNKTVDYTWTDYDGNLFQLSCFNLPNDFQPSETQLSYTRDKHGFRNDSASGQEEPASIIVLGDSFTDGTLVQSPFWDGLADNMLVLAYPGTGTIEQTLYYRAYGRLHPAGLVILAYFEGNDIFDNFARRQSLTRQTQHDFTFMNYSLIFQWIFAALKDRQLHDYVNQLAQDCPYPLTDSFGRQVGFYSSSLINISSSEEELLQSGSFAATQEAIHALANEVSEAGSQLLLVYIPTSAQVYWDGLLEAGNTDQIVGGSELADQITAHRNAQRHLLMNLSGELGLLFLDLTPDFIEQTANGPALYCLTDEHWCQTGHDLAREIIRDFLIEHDLLPQSEVSG